MSIHNNQTNSRLKKLVAGSISGFWIGANDIKNEENFTWSDNSTFDFQDWTYGQPDSYGGNQDCVRLYSGTAIIWDDDNCENKQRYICNINGNIIIVFSKIFIMIYKKWKVLGNVSLIQLF